MKKHIPNFLTLLNLLSGSVGVIIAFEYSIAYAAFFIWLGALCDFLDGFSARILSSTSKIGKPLDMLADLITFGLLPTVLMYRIMAQVNNSSNYLPFISLYIVICSALRLAKFSISKHQSNKFIGFPTPAHALLLSTLPLIVLLNQYTFVQYLIHPWVLLGIVMVFASLMLVNIPFINFKFNNFSWKINKLRYIYLLSAQALIICFQIEGIALAILWYIIFSLIFYKKIK